MVENMQILLWLRFGVTVLVAAGVLLASIAGLIDAARVPESAFAAAGNRTKRFWMLLLGGGLLVSVLGALQMTGIMLNILAIIPAAAYWYGVRDEVKPRRSGSRSRVGVGAGVPLGGNLARRRNKNVNKTSSLDSRAAGNPNDPRFDA